MVNHPLDLIPDFSQRRDNPLPHDGFGPCEQVLEFEDVSRMSVAGGLKVVQGETLEFRTLFDLDVGADVEIQGLVFGDGLVSNQMYFSHLLRGGGD